MNEQERKEVEEKFDKLFSNCSMFNKKLYMPDNTLKLAKAFIISEIERAEKRAKLEGAEELAEKCERNEMIRDEVYRFLAEMEKEGK